jgi:hypothetical protein
LEEVLTGRFAGRAVGALVVLAALPGLASCSPAARPLIALRAVDGRPTILMASCDDFRIRSISVFPDSAGPTASVSTDRRRLERVDSPPAANAEPESLDLFGAPPAGWTTAEAGLTGFTAGQSYTVAAYDRGRPAESVSLFTLADLSALGPDQVLVGDDRADHKATTEKEFRRKAADSC